MEHSVIPAQAGIQQKHTLRVADKNIVLSGCAGFFNWLDSSPRSSRGLALRWNDGNQRVAMYFALGENRKCAMLQFPDPNH
jgi:hypothetical protein